MVYKAGKRVRSDIFFRARSISLPLLVGLAIEVVPITQVVAQRPQASQTNMRLENCSGFAPKHAGLASAASPTLRKLAQYEQVCDGALASRSSFFVPTPATASEAAVYANSVAATLKEYAHFDIQPLVFLEPNTADGSILDLDSYSAGDYDAALNNYFLTLKNDGVTNAMMGMWVLFPEGNSPVWNNVDPATFATNVAKTARIQKKYFPGSQASIMLNSETYPSGSSWNGGAFESLLPYIQNIPKGLIDSFGLQGFPWTPPTGQPGALLDPRMYLPADMAAEAAHALGVRNIWFNTGTFSRDYIQDPSQTVTISAAQRQAILAGVLTQAQSLRRQGFSVAIHLFAQDKSNTSEDIDWSYWHDAPDNSASEVVFKTLAHDARTDGISLWIFDTY